MTDARAALAPLYEAMDILDGAADTPGTRAAILKAICRSVAFLERERDRCASLPAAPAGWRAALEGVVPNGLADGRDIQALHAAISRHSWHDVEAAAATIRDKLQRVTRNPPTAERKVG